MERTIVKGLILAAGACLASPMAQAALPDCPNQCACSCGFGCWNTHACMLRGRRVEHAPLVGIPNRFLVTCTFRGGIRTDSQGTYFCCNHSISIHDHAGYYLNI